MSDGAQLMSLPRASLPALVLLYRSPSKRGSKLFRASSHMAGSSMTQGNGMATSLGDLNQDWLSSIMGMFGCCAARKRQDLHEMFVSAPEGVL